jgi:hypothetical protein
MEEGPLDPEDARKRLRKWAAEQGIVPDAPPTESEEGH